MIPQTSDEQNKIVDAFTLGRNIGVQAFAGTGKSFTLKEGAYAHPDIKMLYIVFGHENFKEAKRKMPKKNVTTYTGHGFGIEMLKKNFPKMSFKDLRGDYKPAEIIDILNLPHGEYERARNASLVFSLFCNSWIGKFEPDLIHLEAQRQRNIQAMQIHPNILEHACKDAKKLFLAIKKGNIPLTHSFYIKDFALSGLANKYKTDLVLVDEAQDTNGVMLGIYNQIDAPKIYVGDNHQQIYNFRGSQNAMEYAERLYYLSATFRYCPEIAQLANRLLANFKLERVPIISKAQINPTVTTAFISRNNFQIIKAIQEHEEARKDYKTVKNPKEIFALSEAVLEFKKEGGIKKGFEYFKKFKDFDELEDYAEALNDIELQGAISLVKQLGGQIYRLKAEAYKKFKSKEPCFKFFCTAHTSKGLEWDAVILADDFPKIDALLKKYAFSSIDEYLSALQKKALPALFVADEINLLYVAITRAKNEITLNTNNWF